MTQYVLNVKLSNSQLKLKSAIKIRTEIILNLSANVVRDSNNENNFLHKLYFSSRIFQNYSVFIPAIKHIKYFHGITPIYLRNSNWMSKESTENITKSILP